MIGVEPEVQSRNPNKEGCGEKDVNHDDNEVLRIALSLGAGDARLINANQVAVREWVRLKCQYGCDIYAKRLTCPPFTPTVEEVKKTISEYDKILILKFEQSPIKEEDPQKFTKEFDKRQKDINDETLKIEKELFLRGYYKVFALEPGTCNRCDECTAQPGKCRFPKEARPPPESLAIDMFETVKNAGWSIQVKKDTGQNWTNYGIILIE
jgi:predicted metal-binding protein